MADIVTREVERTHSRYSPSRSERFFNCPGSLNLIDRVPSRGDSPYAAEGRKAHAVLQTALCLWETSAYAAAQWTECVANDTHLLNFGSEFLRSVQDALDHVWTTYDELDLLYGDVELLVEERVNPPVTSAPGEAYGYLDVALFSAKGRVLYIFDYKHGAGVVKAAVGNTQAKQYAAGLLFEENARIDPASIDFVYLGIIQPRTFHAHGDVRVYQTTVADIADYLFELDEAIERTKDPYAPLVPDPSWCQFCEARSSCPALANSGVAVMLGKEDATVSDLDSRKLVDPKSLDIGRLGYILAMKPLIMTWLNGVESHADELSRQGISIPGFKRVEAQARRSYYGEKNKIAQELASLIGCDIKEVYKEPDLLNIGDMEDKIVAAFKARVGRGKKKKAAEDARKMFAYYTLKQSSGNTVLVPLDDKRPAVNVPEKYFGNVLLPPQTKEVTP